MRTPVGAAQFGRKILGGITVDSRCNASQLLHRLHRLLKRWHDKCPAEPYNEVSKRGVTKAQREKWFLTVYDQKLLKRTIRDWRGIECSRSACIVGRCPYLGSDDWVEFRGFSSIYAVIDSVDISKPLRFFPTTDGFDVFNVPWARRPGHYNP